jgi:hypothetical protein
MSKLALLIGAKPEPNKVGPVVRLEGGSYIVELENVVDSVLLLCSSLGPTFLLENSKKMNLEPGDYQTIFSTSGSEKYINAAVTKVA